ncbi:MAG: transcription antitermination factor NusB [Oscillospiraceae bacterium]|nr:transcription antitermination factor NusB [Oscillospiraceae bacterium]MBQ8979464.1 transcription antitermination factor NusB [Oscillospiraceae bacterium]
MDKKQLTRENSREAAFMLIFEKMFRDDSCEDIIEQAKLADEYDFDEYSKELFTAVTEKAAQLDEIIGRFSQTRAVDRMSKVSLAVMRIAVYESLFTPIPVNIAVSEAVIISQKYSLENDTKFVNGLLGSFAKSEYIPEDKRSSVTVKS